MNKSRLITGQTTRGLSIVLLVAALFCLVWMVGCVGGEDEGADGMTTTSSEQEGLESGDVEGAVGQEIELGKAVVMVRALHSTFQPATPAQRLSDATPTAPGVGETFYQAYVRVENTGVTPIRVDAEDFVCAVGGAVVAIEPTRSGPFPRSLLKNTSLDLLLTFRAPAGYQPVLVYSPPWYDGIISISPEAEETTTSTT